MRKICPPTTRAQKRPICARAATLAEPILSRAKSAIWAPQWWIRPLVGCLGLTYLHTE